MSECPGCHGMGVVPYWFDGSAAGWQRGTPLCGTYQIRADDCVVCGGDGVVEGKTAEATVTRCSKQ